MINRVWLLVVALSVALNGACIGNDNVIAGMIRGQFVF